MNPKEQSLRGDRVALRLNTWAVTADRHPDQRPEGEVIRAGTAEETKQQVMVVNDRRARAVDEAARLGGGNQPLKGESRTWQWDETSPRGCGESKPSRACETPRAERRAGLGCSLAKWISAAHVAMGKETPRKALLASVRGAGSKRFTPKRRESSREDEPVFARERGTTQDVMPWGAREIATPKWPGVTRYARRACVHKTS
jgi:hypothetical protein